MNILELDKTIARLNPYNEKELRRYYIGLRRKLERKIDKSLEDIATGNIPEMLKRQSK